MDREKLRAQIIDLLDREAAGLGCELIDVRLFFGGGRLSVRVYLDRPGGIDLQGCAVASRTIDMLLEESRLVEGAYVIEVSSPGVRRPLRTPTHFAAAIGQRVELKVGSGAKPRTIRGELVAADAKELKLRAIAGEAASHEEDVSEDGERAGSFSSDEARLEVLGECAVALSDISAANLDPVFDIHTIINADRRRHREQRRAERKQTREARQTRIARRRRPRKE